MTEIQMRILKTATCKSITGKSTLTYQLGATPDNAVHIHISKNSASGQFSAEWIGLDDILKALAEGRKGDPLTSYLLAGLFKGRSVNTPAFVFAALTQEKLLRVLKGRKRGHELVDVDGFKARMDKLVTAGKSPGVTKKKTTGTSTRKARLKRKAVVKKKAS